jgi:hypothetical protein
MARPFAVVIMNQQDLGGVGATAALALVLTAPVVAVAALAACLPRRPGSSAADPAALNPVYPERAVVPLTENRPQTHA